MAIQYAWDVIREGHVRCYSRARREGGKEGGLVTVVPSKAARYLRACGWNGERLRITIGEQSWLARTRPRRSSVLIALPTRYRPKRLERNDRVVFTAQLPSLS